MSSFEVDALMTAVKNLDVAASRTALHSLKQKRVAVSSMTAGSPPKNALQLLASQASACRDDGIAIARLLMNDPANCIGVDDCAVLKENETPLLLAIMAAGTVVNYVGVGLIEFLILAGADVDAVAAGETFPNHSALDIARSIGRMDIYAVLFRHGASHRFTDEKHVLEAFERVRKATRPEQIDGMCAFPFVYAADARNVHFSWPHSASLLTSRGFWRLLHSCTAVGNAVSVAALLQNGADADATIDDGCTALTLAPEHAQGIETVPVMLAFHGANPNSFADNGECALGAACDRFDQFSNREVVRLLLQHGAMPLARHGDSVENAITRVAALGADAAPACLAMMLEYTGLDDWTRKLLLQRWKGYSDQIKAALVAEVFDKE